MGLGRFYLDSSWQSTPGRLATTNSFSDYYSFKDRVVAHLQAQRNKTALFQFLTHGNAELR